MASIGRAVVQLLGACAVAVSPAPAWLAGVAHADQPTSATGHVEFVNLSGNDVAYSFSAVNQPNGAVAGEMEAHIHRANGQVVVGHGTVTCVTVNGNIARIGAVLDRFTVDGVPDTSGLTDAYVTVVDNGEGASEPADLATNIFIGPPGRALQHCTTGLPHPLFPVDEGNVQVRD